MSTTASETRPASTPAFGPAPQLVDPQRARHLLETAGIDLLCVKQDEHLYYLSGYISDASRCHFYDDWACVAWPRSASIPGALFVPDYDLAYMVTRPSWLPELRAYGSEWSSAGSLLKEINAGVGIETELRAPLRELFARTRPGLKATMTEAVLAYVDAHFGSAPLTIGCDDLRYGQVLAQALGGRATIVDARPVLRRIRAVKSEAEIDVLRQAALINDRAMARAAAAVRSGGPWRDMVDAYRVSLAGEGAKPLGERGMLFNGGPDGSFVLDPAYIEAKRFRGGDTVLLDCISEFRLYHADMARTAVVGEPTARQRQLHRAVVEALAAAEAQMRPGTHTSTITEVAARVLRQLGLEPRWTTLVSHPIGLRVFDYAEPEHEFGGWQLEAGMVMNFEVFYRDPQEGGMHFEDTVVIRPNGLEIFSPTGRDLIVAN
ncbi:MAG: M24 family metallopeptidase [Lautropia sp.]